MYIFIYCVCHAAAIFPNKNNWTKFYTFFRILFLGIFFLFFIVCFPLLVVSFIGALHVPVAAFLLLSVAFIHYCVAFFLPIFVFVFPLLFLLVPLLLLLLRFLFLSPLRFFRLERRSADVKRGRFVYLSIFPAMYFFYDFFSFLVVLQVSRLFDVLIVFWGNQICHSFESILYIVNLFHLILAIILNQFHYGDLYPSEGKST